MIIKRDVTSAVVSKFLNHRDPPSLINHSTICRPIIIADSPSLISQSTVCCSVFIALCSHSICLVVVCGFFLFYRSYLQIPTVRLTVVHYQVSTAVTVAVSYVYIITVVQNLRGSVKHILYMYKLIPSASLQSSHHAWRLHTHDVATSSL